MTIGSKTDGLNWPALLAAITLFLLLAGLYLAGRTSIYTGILAAWGVDAYAYPFLDTDTILSAIRCLRIGVDVFAHNPCDPLERVYDYSPLWLVLRHLPITLAWLNPIGLAIDGAFLLSLLLLPVGRDRDATGRIVLAVLSSAVVYAVERGNNDLVLFSLAAVAATLVTRSPRLRLVGYAAALLAGLLKYYPMTLMLLATREKPARFFLVAAASVAATGVFLAIMGDELLRALQLIPVGPYLSAMFGSSTLPGGLALVFGWPASVTRTLHLLLSIGTLLVALGVGTADWFRQDMDRLTERERSFLLVGALLILSCFFTAQNIGYRATHLVLAVPTLTALCRIGSRPRLYGATLVATLGVLWAQCWRQALDGTTAATHWPLDTVRIAGWMLREAMWWWTVPMLAAAVVALLLGSEMAQALFAAISRRGPAPDSPLTASLPTG